MERKRILKELRQLQRKRHVRRLKKITTFENISFQIEEDSVTEVHVKVNTEGIIISPTDETVYPTYIPQANIETYDEILPNNSVDLYLTPPKQPSNLKFQNVEQRTRFILLLRGMLQLSDNDGSTDAGNDVGPATPT